MRIITSLAVLLMAATAWAVRPSFQAELDVTNAVEVTAGAAYQISGKVTDRSVMGYDGTSVAASNLVFSETITGDVDAWMVTNVVFSNAVHVTLDVVYLPLNTTNLTLEFPVGIAALCSVTDNDPQYPNPPSSTGAEVSQHVLNQIRSYSFSLVPEGDKGLGVALTNEIAARIASDSALSNLAYAVGAGATSSVSALGLVVTGQMARIGLAETNATWVSNVVVDVSNRVYSVETGKVDRAGDTMTGPLLTTVTNSPSDNELARAGWVRGLFDIDGLGLVVTGQMARIGLVETNLTWVSNTMVQGATIVTGATASVTRSGTNLAIVVPSGGGGAADGGATNIAAGATDSYDAATRTLTWNTNAAGGGTGDASLWYEWPARDRIAFDVLPASNYFGGEAYNQAEYKGEIGTIDWTDAAKVLVQDDDPAVLELDTGEIGKLLVTTNYSLTGGTGIFVRAVTVHSRYEGEVSDLADASILLRYGDLTWADAEVVGAHVPESSFATYSDTHTFPSPVSRNDLADLEVGFWLTNGAFGATGRVDALWVELVGAEPWDIGPEADGDFGLASGGSTRLSVSTGGVVTATAFVGDGSGLTGLPLPDLATLSNTVVAVSNIALTASNQAAFAEAVAVAGSNLALIASNAAASVRADFDPLSNTVSTLKGQFDASSNAIRTATLQVTGGTPTNGALLIGDGDVGLTKWSLPVAFRYTKTNNQIQTGLVSQIVTYTNKIYDIGNSFDGSIFTAPVAGIYSFEIGVYATVPAAATYMVVSIAKGGVGYLLKNTANKVAASEFHDTIALSGNFTNSETLYVTMSMSPAATTNTIASGTRNFISGYLVRELP